GLLFGCFLLQAREPRRRQGAGTWRPLTGAAAIVLAGWYLGGAFVLTSAGDLAGVEMGTYAANLLWPLDGAGASRWVPALPLAGEGQWEGRAWPGLGGWLLVGCALAQWVGRARRQALQADASATGPAVLPSRAARYLLGLMALAAVFALSPRLTLGSRVLVDASHWTPRLLEAFHASGRFNWLVVYG